LGLRALYFLLAGLLERFHLLAKGLSLILAFIGVKLMLQAGHKVIDPSIPEIPSLVSLGVIVTVLAAAIGLSLMRPAPHQPDEAPSDDSRDDRNDRSTEFSVSNSASS
jgi:tellurite resistance protein TerC